MQPLRRGLQVAVALLLIALSGAAAAQSAPDVTGAWQGTLRISKEERMVLRVTGAEASAGQLGLRAILYSLDGAKGPEGRTATSVSLAGTSFKFAIVPVEGSYEGRLSADGNSIVGTWTQAGQSHELDLVRTNPETAWTIPEPKNKMAADAMPRFEVATIKPSDPNSTRRGFHFLGRHVSAEGETVENMMALAYGAHEKQIAHGPAWLGSDRYDIDGVADVEGEPNLAQMQEMYRRLLAERFKLTFHPEKRELPVYAITVAKRGAKLTKSERDPNSLPGEAVHEHGAERAEEFANVSMADFALILQFFLDRPVVDQTGLVGKFDFVLKWTTEDSQAAMGIAPPGLFTAMQEQLGLKLEAVKAQTKVLVVDGIERPSAN